MQIHYTSVNSNLFIKALQDDVITHAGVHFSQLLQRESAQTWQDCRAAVNGYYRTAGRLHVGLDILCNVYCQNRTEGYAK